MFLLLIGAFNRYISVPLLQQWAGFPLKTVNRISHLVFQFFPRFKQNQDGKHIAYRFMGIVKIEAFLIVVVLLCSALLRHEVPARHYSHIEDVGKMARSQQSHYEDRLHNNPDHNGH